MNASRDEYARMAPLYDAATAWALDPIRRDVARFAAGRGPALDVCCGTGRQCLYLQRGGVRTVGLDISAAMLGKAASLPGGPSFVRGDAARLPFADARFAFTCVTLALHEKPPALRPSIVSEMIRVTAPGGRLAVVDYLAPTGAFQKAATLAFKAVERLAGREHHAFYAHYMHGGGLEGLLAGLGLKPLSVNRRFLGVIGIALIERPA